MTMLDRPDPDLRFLLEPPPAPDDGATRARLAGTRRRRRRLATVVGGVVAVLVATAGLVIAVRDERRTVTTVDEPEQRANPPIDAPEGDVPEGWRIVDSGKLRLAVPPDWDVRQYRTRSCPAPGEGALLLLAPTEPAAGCRDGVPLVQVLDLAQPAARAWSVVPVEPGELYDLPAIRKRVAFSNVAAELVEAIVSSFTTSARERAVHDGPVVDVSTWQVVGGGPEMPVRVAVPPGWEVVDSRERPAVLAGECREFAVGDRVVVGANGFGAADCPPANDVVSPLVDGVWLDAPAGQIGDDRSEITVNGRHLTIEERSGEASIVDVVVSTPEREVIVSVSVGEDPVIARTILTTITAG